MVQIPKRLILCFFFLTVLNNTLYSKNRIVFIQLDDKQHFQTIRNFGASGCWYAEPIGKYWATAQKERLAEMLFSTDTLSDGSPKGLGLSAWRFNIGAGTAEQGDSSGIPNINRRVECFLNRQGDYDWNKESGYQWFLRKAKEYNVPDLIAFVNSPPVFFTKNGLGFSLKGGYSGNLSENHYKDFAEFLSTVIQHFEKEGIHFNYLSPINEPQWEWHYNFGEAQQEGTPYTNEEIYRLVKELNNTLKYKHLDSKILFPEAAKLNFLTDSSFAVASNQIEHFWNPASVLYLGNNKNVAKIAAGHGYFTDTNYDVIYSSRDKVASKTLKYGLEYWQTEYSMLSEGYKEGSQSRTTLDCGLFLAKLIHYDLTVGNASAWQYWNAFEPCNPFRDTRYCLFALNPENNWKNGKFFPTGNFYALAHFSYFIRPGMKRIQVQVNTENKDLLISAYEDEKTKKTVIVIVNYSKNKYTLKMRTPHKRYKTYETNETHQLQYVGKSKSDKIILSSRAIYTFTSID